ncbi:MAG: 30S ribosomal protein S8 [bacterium]
MVNDPIGDLLTQIRNAMAVKKEYIELPQTTKAEAVCVLLKKHNFIADFKKFKDKNKPHKSLHLDLKYLGSGIPALSSLRRLSKPGRRLYKGWQDLPVSKGGNGLVIVSTSRGVMDSLSARKKHLGGEIWCEVF